MNLKLFSVVLAVTLVMISSSVSLSYASLYDSPRAQLASGISPEDIQCNKNLVLVLRTNGNVVCVTEKMSEKLGWKIINTFPILDTKTVEPIVTTLDLSSPIEFVDDGREFPSFLQKRPAPAPIYDRIMEDMNNGVSVDSKGFATFTTQSHEKYSVNNGVGLYAEDWMPTYIPDGFKLLYAGTECYEVSGTCALGITFVPSTFVLYQNVTDYDLQFSKGFSIGVSISETPQDEIEDVIEKIKEIKDSQPRNYGIGYVDYTRDGKTVLAYEGGNALNFYRSILSFNPDEFTNVAVLSTYLSLEEITPIFESIMK